MFELLGAEVALVLVLTLALPVDTVHVTAQTALALKLLEADVAVVTSSLMFCLYMHVTASGGPEVLATPLARIQLGLGVNGFYVPGHVGRPRKRLAADLALVLCVLVLCLAVDGQTRLRLVAFATGHAFVRSLLRSCTPLLDITPLFVNLLDVTFKA